MPRTIDYWFSLVSPWAFLGHQAFLDLAKQHGVTVTFKPVELSEVFPHTGGLPLPKRHPARQRYRILELQRWREARGIRAQDQAEALAVSGRAREPHGHGGRGKRRRSRPLYGPRLFGGVGAGPGLRRRGDAQRAARAKADTTRDKMLAARSPTRSARSIRRARRKPSTRTSSARPATCSTARCSGARTGWDCWRARSRAAARPIGWMRRCEAACR